MSRVTLKRFPRSGARKSVLKQPKPASLEPPSPGSRGLIPRSRRPLMLASRTRTRGRISVLVALAISFAGLQAFAASPVQANPGTTELVVKEVYGAGGNSGAVFNADFVELYNPTAGSKSLNGLSVQYRSAGGGVGGTQALPNVSIGAGSHYLVQMSAAGANGRHCRRPMSSPALRSTWPRPEARSSSAPAAASAPATSPGLPTSPTWSALSGPPATRPRSPRPLRRRPSPSTATGPVPTPTATPPTSRSRPPRRPRGTVVPTPLTLPAARQPGQRAGRHRQLHA